MSEQPPELLTDFRVFPNWRERSALYERISQTAFAAALVAVIVLMGLISVYRFWVEWVPVRMIFTAEAVWIILLSVGGWAFTRTSLQNLASFLAVAIVAVLSLLLTVIVAPWLQADLQSGEHWQWSYGVISLVPIVIAVMGTLFLIYRHCGSSMFCGAMSTWRLQATFLGTVAGILLLFQQLLAAVFAGAALHGIERQPLLYVQWFVTVVVVHAVAEELIFRGAIFDYLHKVRGISLWWAVLVTLLLNLLIYLPLIPPDLSQGQLTIFLLQPAMLAVTCSLLWSWERGVSACLACNITFRLLLMLLW
jgi:membrane protease YdiL (CAAX protease family)